MTKPLASIERLKELLTYDQEAGVFTWNVKRRGSAKAGSIAGSKNTKGYINIKVDGTLCCAHRIAWATMTGAWPTDQIDHKNCIKTDNAFSNLRQATNQQNVANTKRPSSNTSGKKGVTWHKGRQRWAAQIAVNGKNHHLGLFDTVDQAHAAYVQAANLNFGEFARAA